MPVFPFIMGYILHNIYKPVGVYPYLMNRKQRGDLVRNIIDQVRKQEFPYMEREKAKINWRDYDIAQCREIADMINLICELVDSAVKWIDANTPVEPRGSGRPPKQPSDIAKVLLLQSYFGVPNRVAEGLIYLFSEKLGLNEAFSYKTIERGYDRKSVDKILDVVFNLTNKPVRGLEKVFSIDGSGTPTSVKQNYAADRQRQNRKKYSKGNDSSSNTCEDETLLNDNWPCSTFDSKHDYVYKVAVIGTKYKLFAGWNSATDHSIGETSMFPGVTAQAIENHPDMETMLGDGIFATRPICNFLGEYNVTPMFLPRRNVTLRARGSKEWVDMLWDLSENPQSWLRDYHMRSISESGYSMLTRANPGPLRKRLDSRKKTEDYLRGICHNIKRLCYLTYLANIIPVSGWRGG